MILDSNTHQRLNIRIVKLFDLLLLTAVFSLTWCTGQRILDTKSQKLDVKKINK